MAATASLTEIAQRDFADLRERIAGPGDPSYDQARSVHNGMIDRYPQTIVRCQDAGDVLATVAYARENGLDLAVRGGSHSVPGFGTTDGGVVADLSGMRGVRVDPVAGTARAEGGCTWGDFNHATYPFGLATTGGIVSSTGIGGLTLGGGIGYLTRRYGLSIDNLLSADVVTADGRQLVASEQEHSDLFWALRGGGGNFGAVTSFEYRLHPVRDVFAGIFFFPIEHTRDVFEAFDTYIADAPDDLGGFPAFQIAPPLPFIPETGARQDIRGFDTVLDRPAGAGRAGIRPDPRRRTGCGRDGWHDALPGAQLPVRRTTATGAAALLEDDVQCRPARGRRPGPSGVRSTGAEPDVHSAHVPGQRRGQPGSQRCDRVRQPGRQVRDGHRRHVAEPIDNEHNIRWVRDYYRALEPYAAPGGYVNFMAGDDQGRVADSYARALREAGAGQEAVRPVQRLPSQPEHHALHGVNTALQMAR